MQQRIGLMGGTFDPIHIGHLILAEAALTELGLDEILFLPTGCSYLKEGRQVADREDRYAMTALAVADNPRFSVSRMEIDRPGNTYTADTLALLHDKRPEVIWYLLTGADAFLMMEKWVRPEEIFALCTVVCTARGGEGREALEEARTRYKAQFRAETKLLSLGRMDLSSSQIRERIAGGMSVRYLVPEAVRSYIEEKGLYQR